MGPETIFEYDLEKGKESSDTYGSYAVRYLKDSGFCVEIGDGYRHNIRLEAKHWNRLLRIIRDGELDADGVSAIIHGLMWHGLRKEHKKTFIAAIKSGAIKEIKE